jgi:hypothetical protein
MNPHNEYFAPNSETLFPIDFKNEDVPNAITCMRKSNNFMQSNCSSPFLKFSSINSINFPVAAIWCVRHSKRPFLLGRSKRKLGRALLCLPFALQMGFCVSSGDTLPRFYQQKRRKQDTWQYPV